MLVPISQTVIFGHLFYVNLTKKHLKGVDQAADMRECSGIICNEQVLYVGQNIDALAIKLRFWAKVKFDGDKEK